MPAKLNYFVEEPYVYFWLAAFLVFLNLTYNPTLANVFLGMNVAVAFAYLAFKPKITFNPIAGNTLMNFLYGFLAFGIFTAVSIGILSLMQNLLQIDPTLNSVWALTSASIFGKLIASSAPVLAESKILTVIVFGFVIAFIETLFIVRTMEAFSIGGKIPLELNNLKFWLIPPLVGAGFVWLHIQAKGIVETAPLILVFIFAVATCIMAAKTKEAESPVYFHQINNTNSIVRTVFFGVH